MSDLIFPVPDDRATQQIWHILSMRYGVFPKIALKLVGEWLHNNPDESSETLKEYLMTRRILVKDRKFLDLRTLPETRLKELVKILKGKNGVEIKDRWYHARKYPQCFVGSEAVLCFQQNCNISKAEAVRFGELLCENRMLHHVLDEHPFKDEHLFYRFYLDETSAHETAHEAV